MAAATDPPNLAERQQLLTAAQRARSVLRFTRGSDLETSANELAAATVGLTDDQRDQLSEALVAECTPPPMSTRTPVSPATRHQVGSYADPTAVKAIGWGRQTAVVTERDGDSVTAVVVDPTGEEFRVQFEGRKRAWCTCGGRSPRHSCEHIRHVFGRHVRDRKSNR